ncbi:DMT family transporter [Microbaculum marinum]|uniref:DMT family transporter n=1 Tax=Microbaculum marinum TaxID=1764581 RepID=A0AAW9S4D0_9HYPH
MTTTDTGTVRPEQTGLGIMLILGSVLIMAFADALVKLVSTDLTVWQVFVARSVVAIPLLAGVSIVTGMRLRPGSLIWSLLRSVLLVLTWLAFYASLPVLSLSVAAVAVYTNPIITALLSAALIGEPVTRRQWGGVVLGFLGVVTILKPGTDAFSWYTILPLLAAGFYSSAMVLTRSRCQREAPLSLALTLHVSFLAIGVAVTGALAFAALAPDTKEAFPFLFGDWAPMGGRDWGLMALLGVLSAVYFMGVARAYQVAAPSTVATFDYAYLVSAALWGFVFFAERPGLTTVCGMVLITAAGLLVAAPSRKAPAEEAGMV